MNKELKELTKAEEQIMQVLWRLKKAFVHDIIEQLPEPKPAYNTVSTIVRILVKKGFVAFHAYGKTHEYYPVISKDNYRSFFLQDVMGRYFGGSMESMLSFFARDRNLSTKDLESIVKKIENDLKDDAS